MRAARSTAEVRHRESVTINALAQKIRGKIAESDVRSTRNSIQPQAGFGRSRRDLA